MSNVGKEGRSFLHINLADLKKLAKIANQDRKEFFSTYSQWRKLYANRVICVALCQGAAMHYLDGITGINDFDIYTFYRKHPSKRWYAKRIKSYDFGYPKFGKSVDKLEFIGRRVDCLSRSIDTHLNEEPKIVLQRYLEEGRTQTAKLLSAKAVILLEPNCGQVIWPNMSTELKNLSGKEAR